MSSPPDVARRHWAARRIHNMVRALTRPYPGAFTFLGGQKLYIWKGAPAPGQVTGQPGKIFGPLADGVAVVTGDGLYVVKEVQLENGPLRGLQGVLTKIAAQQRIYVSVTLLNRSVSVEVDPQWVRRLSTNPGAGTTGGGSSRERTLCRV